MQHSPQSRPLDPLAIALTVALCLIWGFNQVAVKLAIHDIPPLIQCLIRSVTATVLVLAWTQFRGIPLFKRDGTLLAGIIAWVLFALEFLLHFVGDLHQPLHASDDHDQGGNRKFATAPGIRSNTLHHDWDTEFVNRIGPNEATIAQQLIANITAAQRSQWQRGTAADWAMESFDVAKDHSYGLLPAASQPNHYQLSAAYVTDAIAVTREQLSKAGVRLAFVLNQALH